MLVRKGELVVVSCIVPRCGTFLARAGQDFETVERFLNDMAMLRYVGGNAQYHDGRALLPGEDCSMVNGLCDFLVVRETSITHSVQAAVGQIVVVAGVQESFGVLRAHVRDRGRCESCEQPAVILCHCECLVCHDHYQNACQARSKALSAQNLLGCAHICQGW